MTDTSVLDAPFTLTRWPAAVSAVDGLISLIALYRSPLIAGRVDADTITACREIVRLDPVHTRAEILTAIVDADALALDVVRRVLARHGWPATLQLADAVILAYRYVVEQRRQYLEAQLECAHSSATRREVLTRLLELEAAA